jgi:hypothetical protein
VSAKFPREVGELLLHAECQGAQHRRRDRQPRDPSASILPMIEIADAPSLAA